ncbi:MAG: hypothetical protein AAGA93_21415, partial [Actinomycetota bacterium]
MNEPCHGNRPPTPARPPRSPSLLLAIALMLVAAACGSEEPGLGTASQTPTTVLAPTTTTTTTTIPTTTIDFDRPISQDIDPLDEGAGPAEIAALVENIRGQTTNIAVQVERLAPFPGLPGPAVAQILDVAISLAPADDDDRFPSTATVRYRTPEPPAAMVKGSDDELRSLGWYKADDVTTATEGGELTEMRFLVSGRRPEELQLEASVEGVEGATLVELSYTVLTAGDDAAPDDGPTYFERLSAWEQDLGFPRAAELVSVDVATADDLGSLKATYRLSADDEADAVATVAAAVDGGDYQLLGSDAAEPPASGPLRLVGEDGTIVTVDFAPGSEDEVFEVVATTTFPLTPLD